MSVTLPLDQMTTAEKLQAMEDLWKSLTRKEFELESPAWHETVLADREERLAREEEVPIEWELAKEELRNTLR